MAIGIELQGESYGLLIDTVGEVLKLATATREANPVNLDPRLARVSAGVHRLEGQLLVVLDVDRVLEHRRRARWRHDGMKCEAAERAAAEQRGVMKTCLVVDDSSVIRKVARRILEGLDFEITEAEDGEQALDALPRADAGRDPARLEHAEDGRLRVPQGAAPAARRRSARRWCSAPPRTTSRTSRARCTPAPTNTS